jgi:acetyl-CoA carboxylase alpha subunit
MHGDRAFGDDKRCRAVCKTRATPLRVITHRSRDTRENVKRNSVAHPEATLRLMRLAEKFGLPVIS